MEENRQIVIGGFIDEYFKCPYRLLKCFRERLKPEDFINSPFVKDVLMKNGLEYEKKVFSELKFETTTKDIMQLIKEKATVKHPWLVIRSDRIQDLHLRSKLDGINLIGVPDIIFPYKKKGYVPIEIKSHKTINKQDKLRLAYYSFILNNLLNTNLNSAYIILKKDAEKGVIDNLEMVNLEDEDYRIVTDILLDLKLMKEGKKEFEPIRSKECSACSEKEACKNHMIKTGNLTLLQGVGGTARQKLIEQNINTIHDLIEFDDSGLEDFDSMKKIILKARSFVDDIIYQTTDFPKINENLVLLDIETELIGDKKIWLIGVWHNNKFTKFYANTYDNEKEMLKKFISFLSKLDKPHLIIYSGSNFDYNGILNRLKSLELDHKSFEKIKFTDICLKLKNSYIFPIQNYKLKPLAEYLGYKFRYTDLDGTLVTIAYEKHIQSGEKLDEVYFVYNEDDVLSMKFIYEWALNSSDNRIEKLFDKSLIGLTDEKIGLVRDYYETSGYFKKKIDKRYPNTIDYELRLKFSDFDLMKEMIETLRHNGFSVGNPYNDRGRKVLSLYGKDNAKKFMEIFKPRVKNEL